MLIYQSVLEQEAGGAFLDLLDTLWHQHRDQDSDITLCLRAYSGWFQALAKENQSWQRYLIQQILWADNTFTQQSQKTAPAALSPTLIAAVQHDLRVLQQLSMDDGDRLHALLESTLPIPLPRIPGLSESSGHHPSNPLAPYDNWADALPALATHYRQFGTGIFAQYRGFRWQSGQLVGIANPDLTAIDDLVGYETQRDALVKNTEALLAGYPALNVLLYGSRGSGKSALIKSLLSPYGEQGLRLIEVSKAELIHLPVILDQIRPVPQKFIIFVDDLTFEEDDNAYNALKVALEGNLTARPSNVVVYATSNRRHLVREFFGDRPRPSAGDEIHAWDTVQEKLSLSDRFGLTLTFEPADQKTYLRMVDHLANRSGLNLSPDVLHRQALTWATQHNGRSGRTARQFVDYLQANLHHPPNLGDDS